MSKKTMKQRIALVAVATLGAGVLSVAPANASATYAVANGIAAVVGTSSICYASNDAGSTIAAADYNATNEAVISASTGANITVPVGGTLILAMDDDDNAVLTGPVAAINLNYDGANSVIVQTLNSAGKVLLDNPATNDEMVLLTALSVGSATVVVSAEGASTTPTSTRANTLNITVVASCVTDTVSGSDSTSQSTSLACIAVDAAGNVSRGLDITTFAAGNPACITTVVKNAYGVAVPSDTFTATATNGARVNIEDSTISLTTTDNRGATSFDSQAATGADVFVRVDNPTGAALSTTVTISYAGQVVATKNLTWVGEATKINVVAKTVGKTSGQGQIHYTLTDAAGTLTAGIATGDVTSFGAVVTSTTDTTITGTTTQPTQATAGKSATFSSSAAPVAVAINTVAANPVTSGAYGIALFNCGSSAGTASVTLRHLQPVTGAYISTPVSVSCAGGMDTYTVSSDKASYNLGDVATFTITAKDSKGNPVHDYLSTNNAVLGAGTAADISFGGGTITKATAVTDVIGTFAGNAPGVAIYKAQLTTAGSFNAVVNLGGSTTKSVTVAYKVAPASGVTNEEVLKSIVALIASINKQIQALQKLILKR